MIQQNIFAGHQITTPSLFGILVEGSLGTRSEIRDGYEVFKNTYVNDKQPTARQKSFKARHSKNIAKGKMSAAYWADKVKW